ncbi:hypothetical protein ACTHPH_04105 [Paenibacillus pasadenensis]
MKHEASALMADAFFFLKKGSQNADMGQIILRYSKAVRQLGRDKRRIWHGVEMG